MAIEEPEAIGARRERGPDATVPKSMEVIELLQAEQASDPAVPRRLERPNPAGEGLEERSIRVVGWIAPPDRDVAAVELLQGSRLLGFAAVGLKRPDLESAFPERGSAARAGFRAVVPTLAIREETTIEVRGVLADGSRIAVGSVRVRPQRISSSISVVIPCYGQAHFLEDALESVLGQTHRDAEVLVLDDGSEDNTEAIAGRYPGVRYLRQSNSGLAAARNAGIASTDAEHIVFLDADDRLLSEALELGLAAFARHSDAGFVAGGCRDIGMDGSPLPTDRQPLPGQAAYEALLADCFIRSASNVMYARWALDAFGGFNPRHSASADYEAYLEIARRFPVHLHDGVVAEYRRHGSNMTRDYGTILATQLAVLRAQRRHLNDRARRGAYRNGVAKTKQQNGEPLALQAAAVAARDGVWAARSRLAVLLRHHRGAALSAVRQYLALRGLDRALTR